MLHRLANNQSLVATDSTTLNTYTDPVPVGEDTNACGSLMVHYLAAASGNTATLTVYVETSNDGVYWDKTATAEATATGPATDATVFEFSLCAAYYRVRYEFDPKSAGANAGSATVVFDLVMRHYRT